MKDFVCISNNCSSSFLYRSLGKEFNCPLTWSKITEADILKAIQNWKAIDWNNVIFQMSDESNYTIADIDGIIRAKYIHYKYSETDDLTPRVSSGGSLYASNVFYKDILRYTKDKYEARLSRMPNLKPSLLLMHWGDIWECSDQCLYDIVDESERQNLKLFILTFNQKLSISESENVKWINLNHGIDTSRSRQIIEFYSKPITTHFTSNQ